MKTKEIDKKLLADYLNSYLKEKKALSKKFGISETKFFGPEKQKKFCWLERFCFFYLTFKGFSIRIQFTFSYKIAKGRLKKQNK